MNNIFDYIKWRGDLTFNESIFNEVDNLIFSAFAYLNLEGIMDFKEKKSLKEVYENYKKIMDTNNIFKQNQNKLFKLLSESKRFKDVFITYYFNKVDAKEEMQIGGLTFILPNDELYVAFKGTDETIIGWKEDFLLSYKSFIPSQKIAVLYLNEVLNHTNKKVYVGGHSKGGNLAMFAALFCENDDKIKNVYNNDGPGFNNEVLNSDNYKERKHKIITYMPKSSIVGNILNSDTKTIIIKSNGIGILQHNLYSWLIIYNHFVYTKELSEEAKNISNYLNDFINKVPNEQKANIVSFIYDFLEDKGIYNIETTLSNVPKLILEKYDFKLSDLEILKEILPILQKLIAIL